MFSTLHLVEQLPQGLGQILKLPHESRLGMSRVQAQLIMWALSLERASIKFILFAHHGNCMAMPLVKAT